MSNNFQRIQGCGQSVENANCRKSHKGKVGVHIVNEDNTAASSNAPPQIQLLSNEAEMLDEMGYTHVSMKAALLIQNWYRRYRARLETRRRCTWMIYQSIEYSGEQDQLKLHNFFNSMLNLTVGSASEPASSPNRNVSDEDAELLEIMRFQEIPVETNYRGPHLKFPLDTNQVIELMKFFQDNGRLHARYLLELLFEFRKILKSKPNIGVASTSISKQITVCGDLHGKLDDLLIIFHQNGLPSVLNPYVFNGDFVDRGAHSVEVFALLCACFVVSPTAVFLNRGNHEDHVMNYRYGFIKEVQSKYKSYSNRVLRVFSDVFSWLPLASVIDDCILTCHGGISDTTSLTCINQLDRHKYVSALRPPTGDAASQKDDVLEWKQILDILWSDPKPQKGCKPNTFRGGGSYFGPDISAATLNRLNMRLLIRSHECKSEGWEYCHNNLVLTVFSASNYYDYGSNRGAYLIINPEHQVRVVTFMATKEKSENLTFTQRVNIIEQSAVRHLKAKILAFREELQVQFRLCDSQNAGFLSIADWCESMEKVLQLSLPWRTLRPQLVQSTSKGFVDYMSTFSQISISNRLATENDGMVTSELYKYKDTLETIFRIMDRDNSGQISLEEFNEACDVLREHTKQNLNLGNIEDLAHSIDINKDGYIDFNEFLEAFRMVDEVQQISHPLDNGP